MSKAKGLYDFDGQPDDGELPFKEGADLIITNQELGSGWLEATDEHGNTGFVPETYIQILDEATTAPEVTSEPAPQQAANQSAPTEMPVGNISWETTDTQLSRSLEQPSSTQGSTEDFDDSWDEDDETNEQASPAVGQQTTSRGSGGFGSFFGGSLKGIGKFGKFVKMGGDAYILGVKPTTKLTDEQYISVVENESGWSWTPAEQPYSCTIQTPKKDSKMKGLKSFIVYQLVPSTTNIAVSRRFKHFDWLYKRLEEKFPCVCIPPLPDKQVTGRFEEDFIEERMRQLQNWLNRMLTHPVVASSSVMKHFLTCTDDRKWKVGKRKAEKDEFQGGKFFLSVQAPPVPLDLVKLETDVDTFDKFVKEMDDANRALAAFKLELMRQHYNAYYRDHQRVGSIFLDLSKAFNMDTRPESQPLVAALRFTGETYNLMADMYRDQPPLDLVPLTDTLNEYRGLLGCFPNILLCQKGANAKVREVQKNLAEGTMSESDYTSATDRASTIGYCLRAEIAHFEHHRTRDYQRNMFDFFTARADFHRRIAEMYERAAEQYATT